jgi:serine/threonine-protein kinase HipA
MTSSSQERECFVYIVLPGETEFVTAGRLRLSPNREGVRIGEFVYGRQYRERANDVALDPLELRLQEGRFETARMGGFFGAIRDAMPDAWGRRVIEHRLRTAELDEFDYLLGGADDRAGALGFGLDVDPSVRSHRFHRMLDLERLQSAADTIIRDDPDLAGSAGVQVEELLELGTSMGGARPKAVVQDDDALWIAKFSREADRWNQPRVEHGLLELGRRCGLNVADSRIASVADRDVLLVRRFDRDRTEAGYLRHRMVSALTLLRSTDNPLERAGWSYLQLADEIRRVSAKPRDDLRELFARMCFNAATSNIDDHPRNHAVLAKDQDWRLSPAYDLTPTPMVGRERRDLALVCGEQGRYANYGNLLGAHGHFLLDQAEATATIDKIVEVVRSEWEPEMHRAGVSEQDCERIAGAFLYEGFFLDLNE